MVVAGGDGQRRGQRAVYRGAVFAGASLQLFQLRAVQLPVQQAGTPRFQRHRPFGSIRRAVATDQRFVLGGLLGQARRAFVAGEAARTQILRRRQGAGGPGLRGRVGGQGQPLFGEGQHGSAVGDDVRTTTSRSWAPASVAIATVRISGPLSGSMRSGNAPR